MARGDINRAARYLLAFQRGEDSDEARAGALLVADALVSMRAIEAGFQIQWPNGREGL